MIRRIERSGYHVFVKGEINGKSVYLLVDTGASRSVFEKEKVSELVTKKALQPNPEVTMGIGADSVESHTAIISSFVIGKLFIPRMKTVFMDLSHVNRAFEMIGIPKVDGIVGGDILRKYDALIDYKNKHLIFYN